MNIKEGYMPFKGYQTYYRIVGESTEGKLPLLVLHGGPGSAHFYLESLDGIAEKYGRQVIYYDQIGCGNSPVPEGNADLYSEELFLEELDAIRDYLKLDTCHILGQSWGGMLAMLYAIKQPKGVASMVVASSPASIDLWLKEANRLLTYLPQDMQDALAEAERTGNYDEPLAKAGFDEYYRRHVCNLNPYPDFVAKSFEDTTEAYITMQGKSEFVCTGKLRDYDVTAGLPSVTIPTLVTSGQLDEATPIIAKQVHDLIPGSKWEIIEGGTHLCHAEFPEYYNELVENFLEGYDK